MPGPYLCWVRVGRTSRSAFFLVPYLRWIRVGQASWPAFFLVPYLCWVSQS